MASNKKIQRAVTTAYAAYRSAAADVIIARLDDTITEDEVARLARRAGAYRAQWEAAERRAELSQDRVDAL